MEMKANMLISSTIPSENDLLSKNHNYKNDDCCCFKQNVIVLDLHSCPSNVNFLKRKFINQTRRDNENRSNRNLNIEDSKQDEAEIFVNLLNERLRETKAVLIIYFGIKTTENEYLQTQFEAYIEDNWRLRFVYKLDHLWFLLTMFLINSS